MQKTQAKKYAPGKSTQRLKEQHGVIVIPALNTRQTAQEESVEQDRRLAALTILFAQAEALVPDPPDSPTRRACRESAVDEAIAEKFRRQGFEL